MPRANIYQWHERLAHLSRSQIRKLGAAKLIHIKRQPGEHGACDICLQSKAVKTPSHEHMPATKRPFERFHFDLVGGRRSLPFTSKAYKYILIVTDDYSRYKWAWALKYKSQAVTKLQWLIRSLKAKFPLCKPEVAYIHSDDARE